MAILYRQHVCASVTTWAPTTVFLPSVPLNGSALIAVVGCTGGAGISYFRGNGDWHLLYENDGPIYAEAQTPGGLRVQVWGAFDTVNVSNMIGICFSGGTSDRGIVVAEYTGDIFRFSNPADRVSSGVTTSPAFVESTISWPPGGYSREAEELLVSVGALDQVVNFFDPADGYIIRDQADIGDPAAGSVIMLDKISSTITSISTEVDHSAPPALANVAMAGVMLRGSLQIPFDYPAEPVAQEPVTENTDHAGTAIGHLIEQFKSHDKR